MLDQTVMDNPHVKIGELSNEDREQFKKALKASYYIRPRAEGEPLFEFSLPADQEVIVAAVSQGDGASIDGDDGISGWDPYDEGYDDGPGDLSDSWTKGHGVSTGQFSGYVAEYAECRFSAELLMRGFDGVDGWTPEDFVKGMKEWNAPRPDDERYAAIVEDIKEQFGCLPEEEQQVVLGWIVEKMTK